MIPRLPADLVVEHLGLDDPGYEWTKVSLIYSFDGGSEETRTRASHFAQRLGLKAGIFRTPAHSVIVDEP